jgi:hypothetical protein
MIAITVITATASIIITVTLQLRSTHPRSLVQRKKGEPGGSPFFLFAVSSRKRASSTYVSRATRTARAVCLALVQL